jgi:type IV pilus assembly protein PilO
MIAGVLDDVWEWPTGYKVAAIACLVLAIGSLDWSYYYGRNAERLAELQDEVARHEEDVATKRGKANAREEAAQRLRDLRASLNRAQARLPDQREIADLLSSVAASGRASGLEITLFRQKPEVYRDFYAEVPVEMQMRGTYHDLTMFLDRVKRLDRIVNVTDIQLTKPRVEGDRVLLEASCTTTTFRFLDEAERKRIQQQKKDGKTGKST